MKLSFQYDKKSDIWCLLNKGNSSYNEEKQTEQYKQLIDKYGEEANSEDAGKFIDSYLLEKGVSIEKYIDSYQKDWESVSEEYHRRAEKIFGVALTTDIKVYLTINSTCPYNIKENYFFAKIPTYNYVARKISMHELWHFYTWYGLGADQIEILGTEKYRELKEVLTVLLNVIYKDLLPDGVIDTGYPNHAELREKALKFWETNQDIKQLWEYLKTQ